MAPQKSNHGERQAKMVLEKWRPARVPSAPGEEIVIEEAPLIVKCDLSVADL